MQVLCRQSGANTHACADLHLEAINGTKGATEISAEAILDRGALWFEGQQFGGVCETKRERERERERGERERERERRREREREDSEKKGVKTHNECTAAVVYVLGEDLARTTAHSHLLVAFTLALTNCQHPPPPPPRA
jgi:hypothetical protein